MNGNPSEAHREMSDIILKSVATAKHQLKVCADDQVWQRVWLGLESASWRTLAVIPVDDRSSLEVVHGLAAVAWHQQGNPIVVADLRTIGLPLLAAARSEIRRRLDNGERVLIATNCVSKSPAATTIARDADKAILCIACGISTRKCVAETIREVGKQRILGTIMLRAAG